MKQYTIPPELKNSEGEKIIGGILSLRQFIYLGSGLVSGILSFIALASINKPLGIVLFVFFSLLGVPFAFIRIKGYTIVQFVKYKIAFSRKIKKLPNMRKERM